MRAPSAVILSLFLVMPSLGQSTCEHQIIVNVRNSKGEFVPDLQASSFRAKVGGHEAAVASAGVFENATRLIVVLDASGSMGGTTAGWMATKQLVEGVVSSAPTSTKLAAFVFNKEAVRKLGFEHSRKELLNGIGELPEANGLTRLWDSLLEASEMFGDPSSGDAVLVITDGVDDKSASTPADVQRAFVANNIRMFTLGLRTTPLLKSIWDPQYMTEEERLAPQLLSNLSKATGGNTARNIADLRKNLKTTNPDAFDSVLNQLMDEIAHFYVLQIRTSANTSGKSQGISLGVVTREGNRERGIVLTHPQKLLPCSMP